MARWRTAVAAALALPAGCTTLCVDCAQQLQCGDVVLRGDDGSIDRCDLEACETCVDACGNDCVVLESFPPRYSCPTGSWDVYAVCPTWDPPTTLSVTDIDDLACGDDDGQTLALFASRGRIDVTHTDFATGCCPEGIEITAVGEASTLTVSYEVVNDFCDCACLLDVSYAIVGVPPGTWTVLAGPSAISDVVTVP